MEINKHIALETLSSNTTAEQRRAAIQSLIDQDFYDHNTLQAIANGLTDDDSGVKDICSLALTHNSFTQSDEKAFAVAPVTLHPDIEIRNLAGDILLKLGRSSVKALSPYLYDDNFDVRKYSCDIIGLVGTPDDTYLVLPLLDDTDVNARYAAIEALGNMRAENAIGYIMGMYAHDEDSRPFILEALGKIGGETVQSFLLATLRNEQDPMLQMAAIDALALCATIPNLSEQMLHSLPSFMEELQPLVVKTIVAINTRCNIPTEFPDEYRNIAYKAIQSDDPDESQAGLLALGESYKVEDTEALLYIALTANNDIRSYMIRNVLCNSPRSVSVALLEGLLNNTDHNEISIADILASSQYCWDLCPTDVSESVVQQIVTHAAYSIMSDMEDVLHLMARMNMNAFANTLNSLLTSEDKNVVEQVMNIIRQFDVEQLLSKVSDFYDDNSDITKVTVIHQ